MRNGSPQKNGAVCRAERLAQLYDVPIIPLDTPAYELLRRLPPKIHHPSSLIAQSSVRGLNLARGRERKHIVHLGTTENRIPKLGKTIKLQFRNTKVRLQRETRC